MAVTMFFHVTKQFKFVRVIKKKIAPKLKERCWKQKRFKEHTDAM